MVATNVKVEKNSNENNVALVRRFTKRVQGSGILPRAKSIRFRNRPLSETKKKQETLKRLKKAKERERLVKLGKLPDRSQPFSRQR
ncbi:MAG: hypothetical protein ACQEP6_01085 [Patescibacteria group bacterium]